LSEEEKVEELATEKHGRGEEEKTFLPRNDTEKHGKRQKQRTFTAKTPSTQSKKTNV